MSMGTAQCYDVTEEMGQVAIDTSSQAPLPSQEKSSLQDKPQDMTKMQKTRENIRRNTKENTTFVGKYVARGRGLTFSQCYKNFVPEIS